MLPPGHSENGAVITHQATSAPTSRSSRPATSNGRRSTIRRTTSATIAVPAARKATRMAPSTGM